jgi:Glycogen recognition site of AMP-activated protein kinase
MVKNHHPLVRQLLDGELSLSDLPPALRAEGEAALRWLAGVDRTPVVLSTALEEMVMTRVRSHSRSPARRGWRWLLSPRELDIRLRVRPWVLGAVAAAAAVLFVTLPRRVPWRVRDVASIHAPVYVRFVLYAPGAGRVAVAGTFNHWDADAGPLAPTHTPGLWTATLPLLPGQHQYVFLVDGQRWVTDPAAPTVDDGFGRQNSVVAVSAQGGGGRAL